MPEYYYIAMDRNGRIQEGSLAVENDTFAQQILHQRGLLVIKLSTPRFKFLPRLLHTNRPSSNALAQFCRQMALVLRAGVPLLRGLEIMSLQMPERAMREEAKRMYREVLTGRTLSEAMASSDSRMPSMLTRMVATGEASGHLEEILQRMATYYEEEEFLKRKIRGAMVYPVTLLVMSLGLLIFVFRYLIPQIEGLLMRTGSELPIITLVVLNIANIFQEYFILILVLILGLFIIGKFYFGTSKGKWQRDRFYSRLPVIGKIVVDIVTARFARTAGIVFGSGIPLLQGLKLIKQNVDNAVAEQAIGFAAEGVSRGDNLAGHLERVQFFDPLAIQMIRIGEETGRLDELMQHMSAHYDREAQNGISQLLTLLEPAMLLIMGGTVALIVVSVMLPLFDLVGKLKIR